MDTTQSKNIISPKNNLKSPSTYMHKAQQRRSRVPIYTNYVGYYINLEGGGDSDGDVVEDDDEEISPR
jgi:hypothetical protein